MNKKLLAAALTLAFAGVAQAQSNVTLYGIADGGIRFDKTSVGTLHSVNSGGESGSRWGLKGSEDIGGGLRAAFQLEQGFDLTDNTVVQGDVGHSAASSPVQSSGGRIFGRTSTVGLTGDFGSVKVGRFYTNYFLIWDSIDPMDAGLVGGGQSLVVGSGSSFAGSGPRFDNGLYFDSATIAGFNLAIYQKFGKSTTDSTATSTKNAGNALNVGLTYANGPVYVGYSWLSINDSVDESIKSKSNLFGGTYDLGVVKLAALYSKIKSSNNPVITDKKSYMVGVTVPLNAWKIMGEYGKITDNAANNIGLDKGAKFLGLGAQYAASKRTDFYGSLGKYTVGANATAGAYLIKDASNQALENAANTAAGFNPLSYQVGIRHKF